MLYAISPLDDRYKNQLHEVGNFFSEYALARYRIRIEIEYLIALGQEKNVSGIVPLSIHNAHELRKLYREFNDRALAEIKSIEDTVKHDVKAIEYYIRKKLEGTPLSNYIPFIHFGLTSEDINNLAYTLMWKEALEKLYIPLLHECTKKLHSFAKAHKNQSMLGMTHGQAATPTTLGKEYAIFFVRLQRQLEQLKNHTFFGKFNGATGTWGAQAICYPNVDWLNFSNTFIGSLGLTPNNYTTQVENRDSLAESYQIITRINTILLDVCRDSWFYIGRGVIGQKKKQGAVGSSTMPHKVNPINFENAEGNIGLANAFLTFFVEKLPVSRMQRDLSDSTVLRNQGVALAHSMLAVIQISKGLDRIEANSEYCEFELNAHWEVLGEALQSMLRKYGHSNAYEIVKEKTQGKKMTRKDYLTLLQSLPIHKQDKIILSQLTPSTYTGLAVKLVDMLSI